MYTPEPLRPDTDGDGGEGADYDSSTITVIQSAHIDALITWLTINGNSCCLRINSPQTVGT